MKDARRILGSHRVIQGNIDPMYLFASEERIREEVSNNVADAGKGNHILNVGHGVIQGTPEQSVAVFCDAARGFNLCELVTKGLDTASSKSNIVISLKSTSEVMYA